MFKTIISLLVMLPVAAFAADAGSDYFHQAASGAQEVTGTVHMESMEVKFSPANLGKYNVDRTILRAQYEMGVMDGLSVGGVFGYVFSGTDKMTGAASTDYVGMEDLKAFAKGSMAMGPGAMKYGASLSFSLADHEIASNGDENAATGGMSLDPYFGYEMTMENCTYGARLAVQLGLTDRSVTDKSSPPTTKSKDSGGEETDLTLFFEHKFSDELKLGVSFTQATFSDEKSKPAGAASTTSDALSPVQSLNVYAPYKLGGGVLLPELSYGMSSDSKVGAAPGMKVDSYSHMNISVGYRIEI